MADDGGVLEEGHRNSRSGDKKMKLKEGWSMGAQQQPARHSNMTTTQVGGMKDFDDNNNIKLGERCIHYVVVDRLKKQPLSC